MRAFPPKAVCLSMSAALLLGVAGAQGRGPLPAAPKAPLPTVRAAPAAPSLPGEQQPVAPGTRAEPKLPRLTLSPPIPEVEKVEYAGNGFIEVAHALVLLTPDEAGRARQLALLAAQRSLAARPQLAEVDVSVYDKASYGGFGGPLPLLTASVPAARLNNFASWAQGQGAYQRVWENPSVNASTGAPAPTLRQRERTPNFLGSASDLLKQQVNQAVSQFAGGARGGLFFKGSLNRPLAALSFDDAPHPLYEPLLLDILRRENVKATFFVIGRNAEAYPYFVRDMVAQGHEVGNHTFHHVRLPPLQAAQVRDELDRADRTIQAITGQPARYFRPPGGDYSAVTLRIAEGLGLTTTFWTDDPGDFTNPGDAVLESRLRQHLRRGGIVLLHDNAPESIEVLPSFLKLARAQGIELVTVGRLAGE